MSEEVKSLADILNDEIGNFRVSQHKFQNESAFIDRLVALYQKLPKNLSTYPREQIPIISMFWNCFGNLIQSTIMGFQGHVPEMYTLMSKSAESLAVARKLSLNSELIETWITRSDMTKAQFKKKWGRPFPEDDEFLHPEVYHIYDMTSDYGRHPNLTASIFNIDLSEIQTADRVTFKHSYFEDEVNLRRMINHLINTYIMFARKFSIIFDGYLSNAWLEELSQIEADFNEYKEVLKPILLAESKGTSHE